MKNRFTNRLKGRISIALILAICLPMFVFTPMNISAKVDSVLSSSATSVSGDAGKHQSSDGFGYNVVDGKASVCRLPDKTSVTIPAKIDGYEVFELAPACCFGTDIKTVVISSGIKTIGREAFAKCTKLTSVKIPSTVTTIEQEAFFGCSALKTITLPAEIATVGTNVFDGCTSLQYNTYGNALYLGSSSNPYFYLVKGSANTITSCDVHNNTKIIGAYAFSGYSALKTVTIGAVVVSIGDYAFNKCVALDKITLPGKVKTIGSWAFNNCSTMTEVTFGSAVKTIGEAAFSGCAELTSVSLPSALTNVGINAFAKCNKLAFTVSDNGKYLGNTSNPYLCLIDTQSTDFTSFTINANTKIIAGQAFHNCTKLASVTIPGKVVSICDSAFIYCTSLKKITIPNSVKMLGAKAFAECSKLASVKLGTGVSTIGNSAFSACTSLKTFNITGKLKTIGEYAFNLCSALKTLTLPDTVTSIGKGAFYNCRSLCKMNLPDGVKSVNNSLFFGCEALSSVTMGSKVSNVEAYAFYGCESLTSVSLPKKVADIGKYSFLGCSSLSKIYIYNKSAIINAQAFKKPGTIYGYKSSTAQTYAEKYGFKFVPVDTVVSVKIVKKPNKTVYYIGDKLNSSGLTLKVKYIDNSVKEITKGFTLSNFSSTTVGRKTVKVTVGAKSASFTVNVKSPTIKLIAKAITVSAGSSFTLSATTAPTASKVTWTSSNANVLTVSSAGKVTAKKTGMSIIKATYTYNGRKYTAICKVTVKESVTPTPDPSPEPINVPAYKDVEKGAWYEKSVRYCVSNGYFIGVSSDMFNPMGELTREQLMQVIFNFAGQSNSNWQGETGFSDVAAGKWYSPAVKWAKSVGLTSGVSENVFGLGLGVTREQLATILMSYSEQLGLDVSNRADLSVYTDVAEISDWAVNGISWAVAEGLIKGTSTTTLSPGLIANRASTTVVCMGYDKYLAR